MTQEILELNQAEHKWIEENLQSAKEIIQKFAPNYHGKISLEALDTAFSAWLSQDKPDSENPNQFINAFGIAYGQHLADELKLKWVIVKDEYGTEAAIHGEAGNTLVFPLNFVAKRYEAKATGFFVVVGKQMITDIQAIKSKAQPTNEAKPSSKWKFWKKNG